MTRIICTVTNDLVYDQRMQRICATLAGDGYEVWLVGRKRSASVDLDLQPFRQIRLPCFWEKGKLFYLEYNLRLLFFLIKNSFDAVCAVDLDTLVPAFLVCRLKNKPCVYDAHEYFTEVPEVIRRPKVQRIWQVVASQIIPRLKHCYTVGNALAGVLSERYGPSFGVIRNVPFAAAGTQALGISEKKEKPIIIYQGVLNEGRGLESAIAAMRWLEGVELWLAGEGDLSATLRALVKENEVEDRVRFLGYLRPAALKNITSQATIGLNLLENRGLSYYYSLANKAFDYIQAGLPSIQMDFPEYRHLNAQYGVFSLLKEITPESIAKAVQGLLENPERYGKVQQACQKAALELNWEKEQEKLLNIYQNIFTTSHPGKL